MLRKVSLLKIWEFTAFAASTVLIATLFPTQALAMTEEIECPSELKEYTNIPFIAVWIPVSGQLESKKDVIRLSRVCRAAHAAVKNNAAWEGVAKKYMVSPEQVKDPLFFINRKATKAARREIVKRKQNMPSYSHLGEILPERRTAGISRKKNLSRTHHKANDL